MPRWDVSVLERLRAAVGDSVFGEVAQDFIEDTRRIELGLRKAVRTGDAAAAKASAHELRGLAGTFGAVLLESSCRAVEASGGAVVDEVKRAAKLCAVVRDDLLRMIA